jgi:hypothetical protein
MTVMYGSGDDHPSGVAPRFIITTLIMLTTILIAAVLGDKLDLVFQLCGLISGNTLCFFMPSFLYWMAYNKRPNMQGRSVILYRLAQILFFVSIVCYPLCLAGILWNFFGSSTE